MANEKTIVEVHYRVRWAEELRQHTVEADFDGHVIAVIVCSGDPTGDRAKAIADRLETALIPAMNKDWKPS